MTCDLIVLAGAVHTMDGAGQPVTAIGIRDGVIAALGDHSEARHWRGRGTEIVDLGSATVTPGLVDSHTHPVTGLDFIQGIDLGPARSFDDVLALLAAYAAEKAPDEWVLGWGLDPNVFGDRPLRAETVEPALGGRPAFLRLFDAHSVLVSSRALELAGVHGPRQFADRSEIVCDAGIPTGLLLEFGAMNLVEAAVPRLPVAERADALVRLLTEMASTGLVGGHVMGMELNSDTLAVMQAIEEAGELPLRLRLATFYHPGSDDDVFEAIVAGQGASGRRWSVGGVKLFMDGTIDNGTAWLDEPDCYGRSTHPAWLTPEHYTRVVRDFAGRGVPTITHAIGDAAVRHVVAALDGAGVPTSGRHRVEHLETLPDDLVPAFARAGLVASMQPTHCTFVHDDGADNWSTRLGPQRAARGWRCRDLRDAGIPVALGSDWPVAPFDARAILADAQLRRRAGRPDQRPFQQDQALTARMALEGLTTQAAHAAGECEVSGVLAPGRRADLTAFAVDPLRADPDELAEAPILLTTVGGHVVHRAPQGR
ncbi:MAG TPA: amidohydrolase [Kineosporiaceae bacterium]|nr:amidohydrolase [Kineosporiaceae bacterium]